MVSPILKKFQISAHDQATNRQQQNRQDGINDFQYFYRQKYSDNFSFIFRLPYKYVNPVNLFYFSSQNPRSFLLKNSIFSAIIFKIYNS